MTIATQCLADRFLEEHESGRQPAFAAMLGTLGLSATDEDSIADLIRLDVQQRLVARRSINLSEYLSVELVSRSPALVDTAIRSVTHAFIALGQSRAAVVAMLKRENPAFEHAIATAEMLSSLLGSELSTVPRVDTLPRRIGPLEPDGKPRYELTHVQGRGSQAVVYRAIDHRLSDPQRPSWVAVKVLAAGRSPVRARAVLDEARKARQIEHPNVLRVFDAGVTDQGEAFIVSPLIESRSLEQEAGKASTTDVRAIVGWMIQVCDGVAAIHAAGLLHCDIKPANVLLDSSGNASVADLGLAVGTGEPDDAAMARDGAGTLAFVAPQQWKGDPGWRTPAADTYALGATLVWTLTKRSIHGEDRNQAQAALADPAVHARSVDQVASLIRDPVLRRIAVRAVSFRPGERYSRPELLRADLSAWLAGEPVAWMKLGPLARFSMWRRRAPLQVAAVAALVLSAIVAPAAVLWGQNKAQESSLQIAADRAAHVEDKVKQANEFFKASMNLILNNKDKNWRDGFLPSLSLMEGLFGTHFVDENGLIQPLWDARVQEAQRYLDTSTPGSLEALNWQLLQGVWLAQGEHFTQARDVLTENLAGWRKRCDDTDPWLIDVRALLASAEILAMADARKEARAHSAPEPDFTAEQMARLEQDLNAVVQTELPTRRVYYLGSRALLALYNTDWHSNPGRTKELLDDAARRRNNH